MINHGELRVGQYYVSARQTGDTDTVDAAISSKDAELIKRVLYQTGRREWVLVRVLKPFSVPFVEWSSWSEASPIAEPEDTIAEDELYDDGTPDHVEWLDENIVKPVEAFKKGLPSMEKIVVGVVAIVFLYAVFSNMRRK